MACVCVCLCVCYTHTDTHTEGVVIERFCFGLRRCQRQSDFCGLRPCQISGRRSCCLWSLSLILSACFHSAPHGSVTVLSNTLRSDIAVSSMSQCVCVIMVCLMKKRRPSPSRLCREQSRLTDLRRCHSYVRACCCQILHRQSDKQRMLSDLDYLRGMK